MEEKYFFKWKLDTYFQNQAKIEQKVRFEIACTRFLAEEVTFFSLVQNEFLQLLFHSTSPTTSQVPLDFKLSFLSFNFVRQKRIHFLLMLKSLCYHRIKYKFLERKWEKTVNNNLRRRHCAKEYSEQYSH